MGYGQKTNPLRQQDDIPLYVIPSIAYYGENWFFDNGNLGLTLAESENYTINLVTAYSRERAFFYRWDPSNVFTFGGSSQMSKATESRAAPMMLMQANEPPKVFNELEDRHFTFLGGAEAFFYTQYGILNLSLTHDMFNVHQGTEAKARWLYHLNLERWKLEFALNIEWKSKEIVDYYFGVRPSENAYWSQAYQGSSGFNRGLEFTGRYSLNEDWDLVLGLRYTKLADEIAKSPLLDEDDVRAFFIGAAYRF
ncbi:MULTISPECIES: MipA/OmpV family protein [Shewanella]|uniref:MipA/OmpV family protein n=1 Tax=Shewanella sp. TaxID=50422 RepID=UPI00257CB981|nr:MipA/OmpV family protein [Shewanella sp.]